MKKIYWIGDVIGNTGPANVNKMYKNTLSNNVIFCSSNNKIYRIFHFIIHFPFQKKIVISGFSKLNYILLKISKIFKKETFYLMHGWLKIESKYNKNISIKSIEIEEKIIQEANIIICVSRIFCEKLKSYYRQEKNKILFVNNGTDVNVLKETITKNNNVFCIISVGGGVKQKNNLSICKAIEKIRNKKIKFIVIGKLAEEGEEIKKYKFVDYYEKLSHNDVMKKMGEANLYIQNSYFETYGLSIVEAINSECDILISKNIGAIDLIENIDDNDIINNNESIDEISKKIIKKIDNINIRRSIKKNNTWKDSSNKLLEIILKQ